MQLNEAIDRIKDDVAEVVSHFIDLKQNGRYFQACCPFHGEKTPSFVVTPARGTFHCFGCQKHGDAIKFIELHENVSFIEAVKIGAQKLNLQIDWKERGNYNEAEYQHREALKIVCERATDWFRSQLKESNEAQAFMQQRGFDPAEKEDMLQLGFAPSGNKLMEWAAANAINKQLLKEAGLIGSDEASGREYDFFRERIIFPISDKSGRVIGFTGRLLKPNDRTGKYINSRETELFTKGKELYALNIARHAISNNDHAFLVEGNFDVKRMHLIGLTNTVAPCGTALTPEQARLLKKYSNKVTLIYDGDPAGQKAMLRNGELLVKEGFHVHVVTLPDGTDPDTCFASRADFDTYTETNRATDYIYYRCRAEAKRCENPAFKSDFIKTIAALVSCYDNPSLHEIYIDQLSGIIKPKKAWSDTLRSLVAEKGPVEVRSYIPKGIDAAELLERGFYAENNCYFFTDKKGEPHQRSNFTLQPLFHIESTINSKRLYEVTNIANRVRVVEIPQKDLVSLTAFQVHVESLGNFWFDGSQSDLNRLKRWLYEKTQTCKEIVQMGWQKEGFWAWGNGIFTLKDGFVPVDSYGIVQHEKLNYYIPAFSTIYTGEDKLYTFERHFIHMEGNITLQEYVRKYVTVFGDNARIAFCFLIASLFRDIIAGRFGFFPILNMFGPKGAGKSACAESLTSFFGRLMKAPNIHNTSKAALGEHVATSCNAVAHMEEYRNDMEMEKREMLKGLWDGVGRTRMNMDKDKKKETTSVDQGIVVTGQQMATADIALFSRFIFLSFTQIEFSEKEEANYNELKEIEKRGLTHLTHRILRNRGYFADHFTAHVKTTEERMRAYMRGDVVETRIFNNWMIPLAAYSTIADNLELPWDKEELIRTAVRMMIGQNRETKKNDDLGNFWKVVQYLVSSNMLFEDGDYKIVYTDQLTRRFFENGAWGQEKLKFETDRRLFYLTTSRVFSLYKAQCLREGDKPMPESTIEYYLRNSPAFVCETKKEGFKKIDPKTGQQEEHTYIDAGGMQRTEKRRTSTTALVFDADKIAALTIGPGHGDDDPQTSAAAEVAPIQVSSPNELPF